MAKRRMSTFERLESGRLNRKQRRELGRQVAVADPGLTIVHANAGGIDVGNESHYVAVPPDRDPNPVREFGCWTAALNQIAEWLQSCRIDTVAMQATGVYWIALYDVLEQHGIQVVLANAQHTKNVPGRKTDVQECQWLMKLHTYGLLRDSFRLAQEMESVRTIWRLRDRHVKEAGRAVQHMQKALTKMNIQLANVISDINGLSGQEIIAAILQGERDPWKLADLKHYRVRASREEVARSLEVYFSTATNRRLRAVSWSIVALPFIHIEWDNRKLQIEHESSVLRPAHSNELVFFFAERNSGSLLDAKTLSQWIRANRMPDPLDIVVRCNSVNSVAYAFMFKCTSHLGKLRIIYEGSASGQTFVNGHNLTPVRGSIAKFE
jgi:transposase